jgi:hypothetical protein
VARASAGGRTRPSIDDEAGTRMKAIDGAGAFKAQDCGLPIVDYQKDSLRLYFHLHFGDHGIEMSQRLLDGKRVHLAADAVAGLQCCF